MSRRLTQSPLRCRTPAQTQTSRQSCTQSRLLQSCRRLRLLAIRSRSLEIRATTSTATTSSSRLIAATLAKASGQRPSALAFSTKSTTRQCRTCWCACLTASSISGRLMAARRAVSRFLPGASALAVITRRLLTPALLATRLTTSSSTKTGWVSWQMKTSS